MSWIVGFIIGIVIGNVIGIFSLALLQCAKSSEYTEPNDTYEQDENTELDVPGIVKFNAEDYRL